MTFLEAINAVLRRLREDTVTSSNSTDYSKLIGDFVNQAVYECEHAWDWNALKIEGPVITQNGVSAYSLSTYPVNVIQGINTTKNWIMKKIPAEYAHRLQKLTPISDSPYYYWFADNNSSGTAKINLYPTPTGIEVINFLLISHTGEYNLDGTSDSSVLEIPSLPIVLNAYARAVSERGEDGGIGYNEADTAYRTALADAVAIDASLNHLQELSWHAV